MVVVDNLRAVVHTRDVYPRLRGRDRECDVLDDLLASVRASQSRVLVLRGEAGIGKSALLGYVASAASGFRVARVVGDQSEMELAFAGVQMLCAPMLDRLERIPGPQRDALRTAFGLRAGVPPDRFLVGLAVLSLLAEVAEEQPLLCLIDDAQWLDQTSAMTFAFVVRRLLAERVGMVFAVRDGVEALAFTGLSEVSIAGLSDADSRAVLEASLRAPLDPVVMDRIVAETGGNPLALVELPRAMTPAEMAGGFSLLGGTTVAGRVEAGFVRRIAELPPQTQRFLVVAAAEPIGDPSAVWRAAQGLGIPADAAIPASADELLQIGGRVLFRHPLVRSAAYRRATPVQRQEAHRALAEVTDPTVDPDRRAWHRSLASTGPDEDVANELERSAGRAQARGGLAAAAAMLERSAALTLDPSTRSQRTIAAAEAQLEAGASEAVVALLATAEAGPLDEASRARVELIRGYAQLMWGDTRNAANTLLLAAKRLEPIDVIEARSTYLSALGMAMTVGDLAPGTTLEDTAIAASTVPWPPHDERPLDLLLDGLAKVTTAGAAAAAPTLRRAISALRRNRLAADEQVRFGGFGIAAAAQVWDHDGWYSLATTRVEVLRHLGALTMLPAALNMLANAHIFAGELGSAMSLLDEAASTIEATGSALVMYGAAQLAGWRGHKTAVAIIDAVIDRSLEHGQGMHVKYAQSARATLYNGMGQYDDALVAAQLASSDPLPWTSHFVLHELVEAATRTEQPDLATWALQRLSTNAKASGTDWAMGVLARSRALRSTGGSAEALYLEAVDRLDRSSVRAEASRAHLLYGEWLRRENRRIDAREHLHRAHDSFIAMGAEAFAERAGRELAATGETVRKRTDDTRFDLTPQEAQIARLAAEGRTNGEIGAALFISARTVEFHLRKVYPKLSITSRRQLRRALPEQRPIGASG
jgi:DNA-binding CsgD family transcriptional regulator